MKDRAHIRNQEIVGYRMVCNDSPECLRVQIPPGQEPEGPIAGGAGYMGNCLLSAFRQSSKSGRRGVGGEVPC